MPAWVRRRRSKKKPCATTNDHHDGQNAQHHEKTLDPAAGTHSHAVDCGQCNHHGNRCHILRNGTTRKFPKVFSECNRNGRCPTRVYNQYTHPPVEKSKQWVIGLANVSVLPSHFRHTIR